MTDYDFIRLLRRSVVSLEEYKEAEKIKEKLSVYVTDFFLGTMTTDELEFFHEYSSRYIYCEDTIHLPEEESLRDAVSGSSAAYYLMIGKLTVELKQPLPSSIIREKTSDLQKDKEFKKLSKAYIDRLKTCALKLSVIINTFKNFPDLLSEAKKDNELKKILSL